MISKAGSLANIDNFGWEEKKRQKLIKRVLKAKYLKFIKIENNMHREYGMHIFQLSRSNGGFLHKSINETVQLLNKIMVSACIRQRTHGIFN